MYIIEQELLYSCSLELLVQDIHILAVKYRWGYYTCMSLPYSVRKRFVDFIKEQAELEKEELEKKMNNDNPPKHTKKYR